MLWVCLTWIVLVPAIVSGALVDPAGAASAFVRQAACDANGDGINDGTTSVFVSNGQDSAAEELRELAGVTLGTPETAKRFQVPVCVENFDDGNPDTEDRYIRVTGAITQSLDAAAHQWEQNAANEARDRIRPQYYRPGPRTSPHIQGRQFVNLEMWLAIDPASWVAVAAQGDDGGIDDSEVVVDVVGVPMKMVWTFSDGVIIECDGPGVEYTPGAPGPAPCGRTFENTSLTHPVSVTVQIRYAWSWTSNLGGSEDGVEMGEAVDSYDLEIGEVQTFVTDGEADVPEAPSGNENIGSSQPINDVDCGWSSLSDCLDQVKDALVDLVIPDAVKEVIDQVTSFLEGCASFFTEAIAGIGEIFSQVGELWKDPQAFLDEKLGAAKAIYDGLTGPNPEDFILEVLGDFVEIDLLQENPAEWAGKMACELAVGILTGGGAKFAKLFDNIDGFLGKARDWMRRHDDDNNNNNNTPNCRINSFPAETPVLMADGSSRRIDSVSVGDMVMAPNVDSGGWNAREVLDQWSHVDTDMMGAVRLSNGTSVSATDDHLFWVENRNDWVALSDLRSGDNLLTVAGPVLVTGSALWPSGATPVWELTVDTDHTFAVGASAIAVHNGCRNKFNDDAVTDALDDPKLSHVSVKDVEGAWERYDGDLEFDDWLGKYATIRKNAGAGSAFEKSILGDRPKNTEVINVDGQPAFIPDEILDDIPGPGDTSFPNYREIKDYHDSVLQPSSNAGTMLKHLTDLGGGKLEIVMSTADRTSASFDRLIQAARAAGVDVKITIAPCGC